MDAAIIEQEAMQLPENERARLADRLLGSISKTSEPIIEAWVTETNSRLDAYASGKIDALDGPNALEDLKQKFCK